MTCVDRITTVCHAISPTADHPRTTIEAIGASGSAGSRDERAFFTEIEPERIEAAGFRWYPRRGNRNPAGIVPVAGIHYYLDPA